MSFPRPGQRVHVMGIAGAGMSAVARFLAEWGCLVTGCDLHDSPVLHELTNAGLDVTVGHSPDHLDGVDVIIWSPAVRSPHAELDAAGRRGVAQLSRADFMAALCDVVPVVGVTGTHGKTTTSSMLALIMDDAGEPGRLLGAEVRSLGPNGHYAPGRVSVEVDESYGTFSAMHPTALAVLNVDVDHLDHYGDFATLQRAFVDLIDRTRGPVVVWLDDPVLSALPESAGRKPVGVAIDNERATWRVSEVRLGRHEASFSLDGPGEQVQLSLAVTGLHNVIDAALAAVLARELGYSSEAVHAGLASFRGAPRRFELLGRWRGSDVIGDYAHLPAEIAATLAGTRAAGYEQVAVVFQPHRVTRTLAIGEGFAPSFDQADLVIVTDIFAAGEANPLGATGEPIAGSIRERGTVRAVHYVSSLAEAAITLASSNHPFDAVLLVGAGDVPSVATLLGATP